MIRGRLMRFISEVMGRVSGLRGQVVLDERAHDMDIARVRGRFQKKYLMAEHTRNVNRHLLKRA